MTTLAYLSVPMDVGLAKLRGAGSIRRKKLKFHSNKQSIVVCPRQLHLNLGTPLENCMFSVLRGLRLVNFPRAFSKMTTEGLSKK